MKRPVNVEKTFLRSVTVMISASALVLAQAEEAWFPAVLTPFVALLTYALVDRRKRIQLPLWAANTLGVIAFLAMSVEFYGNTVLGKLMSGAHLLVYISWVVLLLRKGIRQFWWLAALSVLQISVASVLTTAASFGASLVGMLLLMLWTLSVFTLYRGQIRIALASGTADDSLNVEDSLNESDDKTGLHRSTLTIRNGLQVDTQEPWIGWRFRGVVGFAFLASLFVGMVTFVVFPRIWVPESPLAGIARPQRNALVSRTGFTENVELGEIGKIMQTEGRVLQFNITTMDGGVPVEPQRFADAMRMDEILFRGNALGRYEGGRWSTGSIQGRSFGDLATSRRFVRQPSESDFRMRIYQDPPAQKFAFAPVPLQNAVSKTPFAELNQLRLSSSLTFQMKGDDSKRKRNEEAIAFEVWAQAPPREQSFHSPQPPAATTDMLSEVIEYFRSPTQYHSLQANYAESWCLTRDLETKLPKLAALSKELCSEKGERVSERDCVQRIFQHLNSSSRFSYSLTNTIQDPTIDPVEDFLINRKTGHCEYFASAAALMLQSVGIPARIVNGYKGHEQNSISGRLEVKQKHAHTWLEAFVDGNWRTLDPTPAARDTAVAKTNRLDSLQDFSQAFSDMWRDLIRQMSPERQEAMVRPWIMSAKKKLAEIRQQGIWTSLKLFWTETVLHPEKWFSLKTGIVTFVLLFLIGLAIQRNASGWLSRKFAGLFGWLRPGSAYKRSAVRFYANFCEVCRRNGLPLPENQTAQENAAMAQAHFAEILTTPADRSLPDRIARAFNQARFGDVTLTEQTITALRLDLDRLGELIRQK